MLRAKRAVEAMIEQGDAVVRLPKIEARAALMRELVACGIQPRCIASGSPDPQAIRSRLNMTQEEFALRYGFELASLKNWEQGRREPDQAVQSYLRVIERMPKEAALAQEEQDHSQEKTLVEQASP